MTPYLKAAGTLVLLVVLALVIGAALKVATRLVAKWTGWDRYKVDKWAVILSWVAIIGWLFFDLVGGYS